MSVPGSNRPVLLKAKALHSYRGQDPKEMTFARSSIILVNKTHDSGWWRGVVEGTEESGWFPRSYVEIIGSAGMPHKVFGVEVESCISRFGKEEDRELPLVVEHALAFLVKRGLDHEGIFRIPPSSQEMDNLASKLDKDDSAAFPDSLDVDLVAGILKKYLRDLPTSLVPSEAIPSIAGALEDSDKNSALVKLLLGVLNRPRQVLLTTVILFLAVIAQSSKSNKMNSSNLAVVFGPTILRGSGQASLEEHKHQCGFVMALVSSWRFFAAHLPTSQFATDVLRPLLSPEAIASPPAEKSKPKQAPKTQLQADVAPNAGDDDMASKQLPSPKVPILSGSAAQQQQQPRGAQAPGTKPALVDSRDNVNAARAKGEAAAAAAAAAAGRSQPKAEREADSEAEYVDEQPLVARALYDYDAAEARELSFTTGEMIRIDSIKDKDSRGWLKGHHVRTGAEGWFPSTLVQFVAK